MGEKQVGNNIIQNTWVAILQEFSHTSTLQKLEDTLGMGWLKGGNETQS